MRSLVLLAVCCLFSIAANAQHASHTSKYAGQEKREIKSLSAADLEELQRGGGWGFAKAAELNGVPGPAHILEMAEQIDLTDKQKAQVTAVFDRMNAKARALGDKFISLEKSLNDSFVAGSVDEASLEASIREIERVRAELRFTHLSAHLETPSILSAEQIALYNRLRGYADDPCAKVPEGHDPAMWKMHNGCN